MAPMKSVAALAALFALLSTANGQEAKLLCTSGSVSYKIGEIACIPACHGRQRLAKCELSNGLASWSYLSDSCPSAMNPILPWPGDWFSAPSIAKVSPVNADSVASRAMQIARVNDIPLAISLPSNGQSDLRP